MYQTRAVTNKTTTSGQIEINNFIQLTILGRGYGYRYPYIYMVHYLVDILDIIVKTTNITYGTLYIYIYIYMCVCVCVCCACGSYIYGSLFAWYIRYNSLTTNITTYGILFCIVQLITTSCKLKPPKTPDLLAGLMDAPCLGRKELFLFNDTLNTFLFNVGI